MSKIEVYTDGSGTVANQAGGWAFVIVKDGVKIHEDYGGMPSATNNEAELTAAINGLTYADQHHNGDDIVLVSDSQLVLGYADASYSCKAQHLLPLYISIRKVYKSAGASKRWVRGHTGDKYNEECDKLAKAGRESMKP